MKWLANWVIFDIISILPLLCMTIFCGAYYHHWGLLIFLMTGYLISWVVIWKKII